MKILKIILLLLIFHGFILSASGQDKKKLDSLFTCFTNAKHDTIRIKTYLNIGDAYEYNIPDSAIFYYQKAIDLADATIGTDKTFDNKNYTFYALKASSLQFIGIVNSEQGSYETAMEYYNKALEISDGINDKLGMSKCYINMGIVNRKQSNYITAVEFYQNALKICLEIDDKKGTSNCYNSIGVVYHIQGDYQTAVECYLKSLKIKEELGDSASFTASYNNIGNIYFAQGNYNLAIEFYIKALKIFKLSDNKKDVSACYNNIGLVYSEKGRYDKAIEYYLKSLKIDEELGDISGKSDCFNNIGAIHLYQESYGLSLGYFNQALEINIELGNKDGISQCYANIGLVFYKLKNYILSIEYYQKSVQINQELGNKLGLTECYSNLGVIYDELGRYNLGMEYYLKALKIYEELGTVDEIAKVYCNIGSLYITIADSTENMTISEKKEYFDNALFYSLKSYAIAVEIGAIPTQNESAMYLQIIYTKKKDFENALKYAEIVIATKDSMFSQEKSKSIAEAEKKFETEKKQLLIDKLSKEKELQTEIIAHKDSESKIQRILIFSFLTGFIIILIFAIFLYRLFVQKKSANNTIAQKNMTLEMANEEITTQKEEIIIQLNEIEVQRARLSEQNTILEYQKKNITDSIRYAKRIQSALLPSEIYANEILGEHFIVFRPKDVVSGDFYWATNTQKWTIVAVADCTGHGVPGAFMSMLGISFLNEIVRINEITNAASILNNLRTLIIDALKQTDEGVQKDGMDMSVIIINNSRKTASWAGANIPLWIIRNNQINNGITDKVTDIFIEEIKPDKMPVAVYFNMNPFTNHEIIINQGDKVFLFSDGYSDQFGGADGMKFLNKRFKNMLCEITYLSMKQQGEKIEAEINKWMNGFNEKFEQIDDITVLGLKI